MADMNPEASKRLNERIKSAKAKSDKENQKSNQSLSEAKGRAQVTATTAMSIVSVSLLKSVLDGGPDTKYYKVRLVLISVSLGLQILAGLMSLAIEQSLGYLSKYGSNFFEDMGDYCCPFRCVQNKIGDVSRSQKDSFAVGETYPKSQQDGKPLSASTVGTWSGETTVLADASEDPLCECCPFVITNKIYAQHEIAAMEKLHRWQLSSLDNELHTIRADEELEYQVRVVDQSKETLAQLTEKAKQPDADSTEINRQMAQLQTTLALANERKTQYENNLAKAEMIRKQGTMLNEYISTIRKTRVLKQASFWQQVLNYVFYTIFIMNAFITGFGLDSSQTAPVGVDVVVPNGTAAGVQS